MKIRKLAEILYLSAFCLSLCSCATAQVISEQAYKFSKVLEWIDRYYVDSVNDEQLVEQAIITVLDKLDPHSSYLTREEVIQMNEPLQGNFEGVGISFNILNDTVYIISPVAGGPSDRAGIQAGDRILKVDGKNIAGIHISSDDVYQMLRGRRGSHVNLTILRRNENSLLEFEVIRDRIPIYSIDAAYKIADDIGYIKINRFALTTMDEYDQAMKKLLEQRISNLIIDLTDNGGGYLEVAIRLADQFLDADKLILYTEGLNNPRKEYYATRDGNFEKGNVVILINESSASASEIVAGAIQDWDRGIIVGRRSFGKGLVQRPLLLPDQSMIRLTIAKYYTPTGRLIQKPYDMNRDDYNLELVRRYSNGEMVSEENIHQPDSLKYYTLKNTRVVYGGGGIMPDYFVSIDTSYYSDYYRQLVNTGTIQQFVLEYVDRERVNLLRAYPDVETFKRNFSVGEPMLRLLADYAASEGINPDGNNPGRSSERIALLVKAYLARDLWTTEAYYQVFNDADPNVETAVMILKNWNQYEANLLKRQ